MSLNSSDLSVLFVASEAAPYVKSGGLGDVAGSLPQALRRLGVDARTVFPKYKTMNHALLKNLTYLDSFAVMMNRRGQSASIYSIDAPVPTYLLENDYHFGREGLYGYWDDAERFAFFARASVEFLNNVGFQPDVIHFNDWQTGLGGLYLKDKYGGFTYFKDMKSVFTIHNIRYQGTFGRDALGCLDLDDGYFSTDKLEFYGKISFMKAGVLYADAVTTVSGTYSREIQTEQYGYGMDPLLRTCSHKLHGILNGIDSAENDPETNPRLFENFNKDTLEKKTLGKKALQSRLGLPQRDVPMIAVVSRLVDQKGMDLVAVALGELMSMDIQLVVLGTGDGRYEHLFRHTAWHFPDRLSANICFDDTLAQQIYAGADIFLMPSLFEPCGLGQLFAMRYGAVPVARRTGGLADTVRHFDWNTKTGNGFLFDDYVASGMMWALGEALHMYYNEPEVWKILVKNAMDGDFSWDASARKYAELYLRLKGGGNSGA